jgi:hypothetical protein
LVLMPSFAPKRPVDVAVTEPDDAFADVALSLVTISFSPAPRRRYPVPKIAVTFTLITYQ